MGNLGVTELIIIAVLLILFFGARKLPELAQGIGKGIREFRKATREIREDVEHKPPAAGSGPERDMQ